MAPTDTKRRTARKKKAAPRSRKRSVAASTSRRAKGRTVRKPADPGASMAVVPITERLKIDKALIQERPPLDTVESVYDGLKLLDDYGVDRETFEQYAQSVRQVHAIAYADRLACELLSDEGATSREAQMDLMTSRLAQRIARLLADDEDLSVSELARLAASAASLRRAVSQAERGRRDAATGDGSDESLADKLHRAVRALYGLDLSSKARAADGASSRSS